MSSNNHIVLDLIAYVHPPLGRGQATGSAGRAPPPLPGRLRGTERAGAFIFSTFVSSGDLAFASRQRAAQAGGRVPRGCASTSAWETARVGRKQGFHGTAAVQRGQGRPGNELRKHSVRKHRSLISSERTEPSVCAGAARATHTRRCRRL